MSKKKITRLTDQEIQTIVSWIDGGAPKGDMADMPKMPALADGWTIGTPDAVYSMTEDYKIPASGTIEYQYIRIPSGFTEDKWVTAVEIQPSNRTVVHHINASTHNPGSLKALKTPLKPAGPPLERPKTSVAPSGIKRYRSTTTRAILPIPTRSRLASLRAG